MKKINFSLSLFILLVLIAGCKKDPEVIEPCYTLITVDGEEQSGIPEQQLFSPLEVKAVDDQGNAIQDAEVQWTVTSGNGTLTTSLTKTDIFGHAQVNWILGASGTQTVQASIVRENTPNCTGTNTVTFSANVGTLEITNITYTTSSEPNCDTDAGVSGYIYDINVEFTTNLDLDQYDIGFAKSYETDKAPAISSDETYATFRSASFASDKFCIVWGVWQWIDATYQIILLDKSTNARLFTSNEETIRIENPVEPPTEIPTITLISAESVMTEINSAFCSEINGSTVETEITYESSGPLNGFFIEIVVYYKFENETQERSYESWATNYTVTTLMDKNCFTFSTTNYVDLSYVVKLYERGTDGNKTGEALAISNKTVPNRVVKKAGANRVSFGKAESPRAILKQ